MPTKILIVDDKQIMRDSVAATLQRAGFAPIVAADGEAALAQVARHHPAAVVTDLKMPGMDGLSLLAELRKGDPGLPVVLMTAYGTVNDAVDALKSGAFDFIQKPFEGEQLVNTMKRAVDGRRLVADSPKDVIQSIKQNNDRADPTSRLIGDSPAMRRLKGQVEQVGGSHSTVLIHGESGTGKEVVAQSLHDASPRRDRPMLCLNCAALSASLLESELFGHERGAFTGADGLRKGRFELADGGTLLLDEVSEVDPRLQAKLLRVLQEGQFERVGSSTTMSVDVRILATTNRDLTRSVAEGSFRQDLYYRLNVLPIYLPPLRERGDDVPALASHFLKMIAQREGGEPKRLDDEAAEMLSRHTWPGNVRELQNICERASVLAKGEVIDAGLLQPWLLPTAGAAAPAWSAHVVTTPAAHSVGELHPAHASATGSPPLQVPHSAPAWAGVAAASPNDSVRPLEEVEREEIVRALGHFGGNRTRTAEALGIGVRTLGLKLKKWKELDLVAQTL